ncbi:D(2) dopamine receptor A-like [Betta splendens]|uniref:D(2) dopamine receptor A-like n=1 Tax=Betta splendens TaxID=158456 RepID=A0A6P7MRP4_BETSP|nr:D(2) dopamine receptor A-like [Betta splendens]
MGDAPTAAWDHGNSSVWAGGVDGAFVAAHGAILLITSVVGTAANAFVILAVSHQKSLQTATNALLVNLAVADALRCAVDCPVLLAVVVSVHRGGRAHAAVCDAQAASFSFGCCIQLLTLACISAERYQAIAQPFRKRQRRRRIMVLIPLTWTLAAVLTVCCLLFVKDSLVNVRCQGSQGASSSYDAFGLYMLLPLWATCFSVITGFYARIFALVRAHNRKIFDKGTSLIPNKEEAVNTDRTKESGRKESARTQKLSRDPAPRRVSVSSKGGAQKHTGATMELETERRHQEKTFRRGQFSACVTDAGAQPANGGDAAGATEAPSGLNTENQSNEKAKIEKVPPETKEPGCQGPSAAQTQNPALLIEPKGAETLRRAPPLPPETSSAVVKGAVCMMPSKAGRERANQSKEGKLAQRAGYIIISFLVFWLPLVTTTLVNLAVYKLSHAQIKIIQDVEILSVSVACVTSLSDPIIYAAVNPQFRTEYYRIKSGMRSMFKKK